jgi:hypothetical protein
MSDCTLAAMDEINDNDCTLAAMDEINDNDNS